MDAIRDAFLTYLAVEKGLSDNTLEAYRNDVDQFLLFLKGQGRESPTITSSQVTHYIEKRKAKGIKEASLIRSITAIKSFIQYREEERGENNNWDYPSFKKALVFPDHLSLDEAKRVIEVASKPGRFSKRNGLIVKMLYGLGLRVSELVNVSASDINVEDEVLWIKGKGNKERLLPLPVGIIQDIQTHSLSQNTLETKLFLNKNRQPLSRVGVWKLVKSLCRQAGIRRNVYPHIFRHSFATHLLANGADIRTVQALLGHEDISSTEIYTHLNSEHLKTVVENCHPHFMPPLT